MKQAQVITINPDGTMEGLRRKSGEGIDLRPFGLADITRTSDICFESKEQKFFVRFLEGPLKSRVLTYTLYAFCTGKPVVFSNDKPIMYFDEYEEAVEFEIEVLDAVRTKGIDAQHLGLQAVATVVG